MIPGRLGVANSTRAERKPKIEWALAALALFAALFCPAPLFPAPTASSLQVTVKSAAGNPVTGARVTAVRQKTGPARSAVTDAAGACVFPALAPGIYDLRVDSGGGARVSRSNVVVEAGQSLRVELQFPSRESRGLGNVEFDYRPQFRSAEVNQSTNSGGYSASAYTDSYDLILAYVASEQAPDTGAQIPERNLDELEPGRFGAKAAASRAAAARPRQAPLAPLPANPTEAQFLSRGSRFLLDRQFPAAASLFEAAVGHYPDSARLETGLGVADYARGRYEEAVRALLRATDLAPADPRPYRLLARAYNVSKPQSGEVAKRLDRWVRLEPHNALAYYYDALSLWKDLPAGPADPTRIEALLERAAALDPRLADAPLALGNLYADEKRYPEAIREYQQAIRLQPSSATAHYRLAQAYRQSGDPSAAEKELDAYHRLRRR